MKKQSDVSLVNTESLTLNCVKNELKYFLKQIEGKHEGFIGHYFGKTPEEYSDTNLIDALHKTAINFFIENNPNVNER